MQDIEVNFYKSAEELASRRLRDFVDFWRKAKGTGRLAPVSAIDPLVLKPFLRDLVIVDVESNPEKPRYRLVGTGFREFFSRDFTGLEVAQSREVGAEKVADTYRAIAGDGEPRFGHYIWPSSGGIPHDCEFALLPFGSGDRVERIVGMDDLDKIRAQS